MIVSNNPTKREDVTVLASYDKIFSYAGTALMGECPEVDLLDRARLAFWHMIPSELMKLNNYNNFSLPYVISDQIKIQFQALGLMIPGTKKRAVSDTNVYWKLTPYGEKYLIHVRARKRKINTEQDVEADAQTGAA